MGYGAPPDGGVVNNDESMMPSPPSSGLFYLNQAVDDDRFSLGSPPDTSSPRTTNPEVTAELDSYDSLETTTIVDVSYRNNRVTWRAANGEARHMLGLTLDLYANTDTNTSIFKLYYSYMVRKDRKGRRRSSKQAVYLYIHPENVRFITCDKPRTTTTARRPKPEAHKPPPPPQTSYYELRFSLTESPSIVVPKDGGAAFESKHTTRAQLDLLQDLAGATDFVVHLDSSAVDACKLDDLKLLGCMFSPTFTDDRPTTDFRRASLASLYGGGGGARIGMSGGVVQSIEVDPPPYVVAPESCLVSTECPGSEAQDDDADDEEEVEEDAEEVQGTGAFAHRVLSLLSNVQTHFNAVERHFDGMERRLSGLEHCVQQRRHEIAFALKQQQQQQH
ncbi:hypothetical protein ACQKWADRAFT_205829 [Trichoderma austrokoningii]